MSEQERLMEEQPDKYTSYNPVTVTNTDTTGLVGMTAIALILLFALLRAQKRIQELHEQLSRQSGG